MKTSIAFLVVLISSAFISCDQSTRQESNKFSQYFNKGQELYQTHCSNCHQTTGTGLGRLYPPIRESDFVQNNFEEVVCLIRYGRSGKLVVNGVEFNKEMPAIPALTDLEIAEISTYIYNAWSEQGPGIIDVKDASQILSKCDSI